MRITIETTNSQPEYSQKVVKEVPFDDLDIWQVVDELRELLMAYGFSVESISGAFDSAQDEPINETKGYHDDN